MTGPSAGKAMSVRTPSIDDRLRRALGERLRVQ